MAVINIKGEKREALGKGGARKARAIGRIPAVMYGHGEAPVALSVDNREFVTSLRAHKGSNPILAVKIGDGEFTALVRDVQYDPLTHGILHLDFQHISLTEKVDVKVPVHCTGTPIGVKDGGGILEIIIRELEVRCLPTAIPSSIDIDVTHLNIGDSVHASNVTGADFEILTESGATIATVVPPTVMEEKPAGEVAATGSEPEVLTAKGKKDEEAPAEEKGKEKK